MVTDSKKVLSLATLVLAAGFASFAGAASAGQLMSRDEAYSAARVDTAFDLVAAIPQRPDFSLPMASKGDLLIPAGCVGIRGDAQAECMDVAYEEPSIVVETRTAGTSTLMRMDSVTVAGMPESLPQSE